ncbi:uncharacterized protein [Magallana gigas]|uniref:uncharacterized protein n=1 Tax=Magallana gigas TaxID=29159 RepID=UPI00334113D3
MIEINNCIQSLKSSWIRRLINSPNSKWNILLNKSINTDIVLKTGSDFISCILTNSVRNSFWKDTFIAFKNIQDRMKLLTWQEFITQPIWYNKNITMGGKSIFFIDWFNKNIVYINDLLDENGSFLSLHDLQMETIYQLPFVNAKSTKLQWPHFRINHHILTTNKYLFKIGKECRQLHIQTFKTPSFSTLSTLIIFGLHPDPISTDIYTIFLVMKSYIYRKRCLNEALTIHELLIDIKTHISTLRYIATRNCRLDDFYKRWETWLFLLNRLD